MPDDKLWPPVVRYPILCLLFGFIAFVMIGSMREGCTIMPGVHRPWGTDYQRQQEILEERRRMEREREKAQEKQSFELPEEMKQTYRNIEDNINTRRNRQGLPPVDVTPDYD